MRKPIGERVLLGANLHSEAVPGELLVEIYGASRVFMENHRGVVLYTDHEIVVNSKLGCITITGAELNITYMSETTLVIVGSINQISREE